MLPNWLYGKSKSKLANILGGGGGTPADYNQVKAQVNQNTEDIELLSDALDDKAAKTQITNPNILHNPWFTINQRNSGKIIAGGNYPCDRWRTAGAGTLDITATTDGLAIVNTSSELDAYVIQRRTATYVNSLRGHKLTGSIMLSDGTIYSGTINPPYADNTYFENEDVKIYTNFNTSSVEAFCIQVKAGKSLTIRAAKLEVGEISTLAMDPRPEYALELAKCQRYFQRLVIKDATTTNVRPTIGISNAATSKICWFPIYLERSMRAVPALSLVGDFVITQGSFTDALASTSDNTLTISQVGTNSKGPFITLSATPSTEVLTPGSTYKLVGSTAQGPIYMDFSAEL